MKTRLAVAVCGLCWLAVLHAAAAQDLAIAPGMVVSIEYTLMLEDGTAVYSNIDKEPLVYEAGGGRVLPGLDAALMGLKAGESTRVKLSVAEAYGEVDENLFIEVELDKLPEDSRHPGAVMAASFGDGEQRRVIVREVTETTAIVDYNHPLAGRSLEFVVRVLDVK